MADFQWVAIFLHAPLHDMRRILSGPLYFPLS